MRNKAFTDIRTLPRNSLGKLKAIPEHLLYTADALGTLIEALGGLVGVPDPVHGLGRVLTYSISGNSLTMTATGITPYGAVVACVQRSVQLPGAPGTYYVRLSLPYQTADTTFVDPETSESITHTLSIGEATLSVLDSITQPNGATLGVLSYDGVAYTFTPFYPALAPARRVYRATGPSGYMYFAQNTPVEVVSLTVSRPPLGKARIVARGHLNLTYGYGTGMGALSIQARVGTRPWETLGTGFATIWDGPPAGSIWVDGIGTTTGVGVGDPVQVRLVLTMGSTGGETVANRAYLVVEVEPEP